MKVLKDIAEGLAKPVLGYLGKRSDNRAAKASARAKLGVLKEEGSQAVELSSAEWEQVGKMAEDKTWKDEYATIVITSPFLLFLAGGVASAFGHPQLLTGTAMGIAALAQVGVDLGFLMEAVVLAAISVRVGKATGVLR